MANIAIAKMSKSIRFNSSAWGSIGGDNEAPFLVYTLAKLYPQHTFWIIGKSDYAKVFPNGLLPNIKDLWAPEYWENNESPMKLVNNKSYEDGPEGYEKFYSYINRTFERLGINIDFAIILYGMWFSCSLFNVVIRGDGKGYTKTLENATKYASFLTYWANTSQCEYATVITDPRQYRVFPRDYVHWPIVNLSQINKNIQFASKSSQYWPAGQLVKNPKLIHKNVYAGVECMSLLSKEPYTEFPEKKSFNLILNQGYPGSEKKAAPRFIELRRWVLSDPDFECSIYGKWDEEYTEKDKRFKGPISPLNLGDVLETTKYTLCIPIAPGWVTAKFLEMAHYGVIPFVTSDYGSEASMTYIPKPLIVKNRDELKARIKFLDENPEAYKKLLNAVMNVLPKMYTGEYLINNIIRCLSENNAKFQFGEPSLPDKPIYSLYKEDSGSNLEFCSEELENEEQHSSIDEFF